MATEPKTYTATMYVSRLWLALCNFWLSVPCQIPDGAHGCCENEVLFFDSATFQNGFEMDIKIYNGGWGEFPYIDSILFDSDGNEHHCETGDYTLNDVYELIDNDGNTYLLTVMPQLALPPYTGDLE